MSRASQPQCPPHEDAPYHHGDLARTLVEAGSEILAEAGVEALTLRAVTRRAGVSATAATPHFGNLTGLRSAIAATGYDALACRLNAAQGADAVQAGMAYLDFARTNPDLFRLMFRREMLDFGHPALAEASTRAFSVLKALSGRTESGANDKPDPARLAGLWGRVHGLAVLSIDGMLSPFTDEASDDDVTKFLRCALEQGGTSGEQDVGKNAQ